MGMLERLSDARGTLEGKIVAVVLAILLVLPVATVTAFAGDHDGEQADAGSDSTQAVETVIEEVPDQGATSVTKTEGTQTPTSVPETSVPETSTTPEATTPEKTPETPVVEEEALDAVLALNLDEGATVLYNGKTYDVYSDEMKVPAGQEIKFVAKAQPGFALVDEAPVVLVAFDGTETDLDLDASGAYTVTPEQVAQELVLQVHAVKVETPEGEEPSDEPTVEQPDAAVEEDFDNVASEFDLARNGRVSVSFNANGGIGSNDSITANAGDHVLLPTGSDAPQRAGFTFLGWSTDPNQTLIRQVEKRDESGNIVYEKDENGNIRWGTNPKTGKYERIPVYESMLSPLYAPNAAGEIEYVIPNENVTLYATWEQQLSASDANKVAGRIAVTILSDGGAKPTEPSIVLGRQYSIIKNTEGDKWSSFGQPESAKNNTNVPNMGKYFTRLATTYGAHNLDSVLTDAFRQDVEAWASAYKASGKSPTLNYDPATQRIEFYVMKYQENTWKWHIDGIVVDKNKYQLNYDPNCRDFTGNCPDSSLAVLEGNSVVVSDPLNHTNPNLSPLARSNYVFVGWNTQADGNGIAYKAGDSITLDSDVTLYAQWAPVYSVTYKWVDAPVGDVVVQGYPLQLPVDNNKYINKAYGAVDGYLSSFTVNSGYQPGIFAYVKNGNLVESVHRFAGWKFDGKDGVVSGTHDIGNSNVVIIGAWEPMSYSATITASGKTYDGDFITNHVVVEDRPEGYNEKPDGYKYRAEGTDKWTDEAPSDAGSYEVKAYWNATESLPALESALTDSSKFVISPKPVTLLSASAEKTFDGTALDAHAMMKGEESIEADKLVGTQWGFVEDQGVKIKYTGTRTNPGISPNTYEFEAIDDGTNLNNYSIPAGAGTIGENGNGICTGVLTVTDRDKDNKIPIDLVAKSNRVGPDSLNVYNGQAYSATGLESISVVEPNPNNPVIEGTYVAPSASDASDNPFNQTATFVMGGRTYEVSNFKASVIEVDAGKYPVNITTPSEQSFVVTVGTGNDKTVVTDQFSVTAWSGTLEIAKRNVVISSPTKSKVYDGTALRAAIAESLDPVLTEEATVEATGAVTDVQRDAEGNVSSVDNTISVVQKEGAREFKDTNYIINKNPGKLTILPQSINPDDNKGQPNNPDDPNNRYKGIIVGDLSDEQYNGNAWADSKKPNVTKEDTQPLHVETDYTVAATTSDTVNIGTKVVTVTGVGNYTGAVTRTYEVTKAPALVRVGSASKVYGTPDPSFAGESIPEGTTVSAIKDISKDESGNWIKDPYKNYQTLALFNNVLNDNKQDDPGDVYHYYRTNPDENDAKEYVGVLYMVEEYKPNLNPNYELVDVVPGNFTISRATATLNAHGVSTEFDGNKHSITVDPMGSGWTIKYASNPNGPWGDNPSYDDAGQYVVYVKATNPNFEDIETSATVTIDPKPVTITVNDATKVAGTDNPEFTATIEGEVAGHELTGVNYFRKSNSEAVGTYADDLTASFDENGNYKVTVVEGDFTITPMAVPATPPTPPAPGPFETLVNTVADFLATPIIGPGGIAAAGAADVADENIVDADNPLAQIEDDGTPMGAFDHPICWVHYYILLGIIITAIYGGGVIARRLGYNHTIKKYEDDVTGKGEKSEPLKKPVAKEGMQPTI